MCSSLKLRHPSKKGNSLWEKNSKGPPIDGTVSKGDVLKLKTIFIIKDNENLKKPERLQVLSSKPLRKS